MNGSRDHRLASERFVAAVDMMLSYDHAPPAQRELQSDTPWESVAGMIDAWLRRR